MADLSICIVSWNVSEDLRRCLQSIYDNPCGLSLQTIVVDNASVDGSPELVRSEFPQAELIANPTNAGFAAANNQALRQATGRYALLLNPDCLVVGPALRQVVQFADAHPEAGLIGPKLVYPDGSLQFSCRRFPSITAAMFRGTILGRWFRSAAVQEYLMSEWPHDEPREVDWVSGAAMLIRRQLLDKIGLLDEQFFWGSEDVDYAFRAHEAGYKVLYYPEAMIIHAVGRSTDQAVVPTVLRRHRSMYLLCRKHLAVKEPYGRFTPLLRAAVWIGVWVRAGMILGTHGARWVTGKLGVRI